MMARFSECAVVSNWLPHTPVQIFFRLVFVHKTIWCSLSSSSIQTGVLAGTFRITLLIWMFSKITFPCSSKRGESITKMTKISNQISLHMNLTKVQKLESRL